MTASDICPRRSIALRAAALTAASVHPHTAARSLAASQHLLAQLHAVQDEFGVALPLATAALQTALPLVPRAALACVSLPAALTDAAAAANSSGQTRVSLSASNGGDSMVLSVLPSTHGAVGANEGSSDNDHEMIRFCCTLFASYAQCLAGVGMAADALQMYEQTLSLQQSLSSLSPSFGGSPLPTSPSAHSPSSVTSPSSSSSFELAIAATRNNMADVLLSTGQYAPALEHYRFVARAFEASRGANDIELANVLSSQASALFFLARSGGSGSDHHQNPASLPSSSHGSTNAAGASLTADANERRKDDLRAAHALWLRARRIKEDKYGQKHIGLVKTLSNLAALYADPAFEGPISHASAAASSSASASSSSTSPSSSSRAELDAAAVALLQLVLEIRERVVGVVHVQVAHTLRNLAQLLLTKVKCGCWDAEK
jgi:tetratricopeptide (TPR) repeat protein